MGKLNIAHHKSYHPYRRDNIERVRQDEEAAQKKIAIEEGRMMLADSEARMDQLRQRAGTAHHRRKHEDPEEPETTPFSAGPSSIMSAGHINLFEDLERQTIPVVRSTKTPAPETEKGIALAPSAKDLNPWYSDSNHEKNKELEDDRKWRDIARKSVQDPLTFVNKQLASRSPAAVSSLRDRNPATAQSSSVSPAGGASRGPTEVETRLSRESSERQRALELIHRKKRELEGSETPSTVHRGMEGGYTDVFNRKEVEEAHRHREHRWERDFRIGNRHSHSQARR